VKRGREPESMATAMAKSAARAIGSQIGRQIVRGVLGSLLAVVADAARKPHDRAANPPQRT